MFWLLLMDSCVLKDCLLHHSKWLLIPFNVGRFDTYEKLQFLAWILSVDAQWQSPSEFDYVQVSRASTFHEASATVALLQMHWCSRWRDDFLPFECIESNQSVRLIYLDFVHDAWGHLLQALSQLWIWRGEFADGTGEEWWDILGLIWLSIQRW